MDEILQALRNELALPEPAVVTMVLVRMLVAALLGAVIGWDRERKGRAAGLKTHILVATGAALFVLAPTLAGIEGSDNTRVMQGIVQGIGFLGAGAILRSRDGERVEDLTTAASVWMTAAIGMASGMGLEVVAAITTALAWLVVGALPKLLAHPPARADAPAPPDEP